MAADLGTWTTAQAAVIQRSLSRAGIPADLRDTTAGVRVSVADEHAGAAQQALAADMDAIARARRHPVAAPSREPDSPRERTLLTERLRGAAPVLATLCAGLMVAYLMPATLKFLALVGTAVAVTWLATRPPHDDEDYGG